MGKTLEVEDSPGMVCGWIYKKAEMDRNEESLGLLGLPLGEL